MQVKTLQQAIIHFSEWVEEWRRDTAHLSSPYSITMHPNFLKIVALGPQAIPLILEDLRERDGDWCLALEALAGESPVPEEAAGDYHQLKNAWLAWGKRRHLLRD